MASRSMEIRLHNFINPPIELRRKEAGLPHGIWENNNSAIAPERIGPFETVVRIQVPEAIFREISISPKS